MRIPDGVSPYASMMNARSEVRATQTIVPMQPDENQRFGMGYYRATDEPIIDLNFYRKDRFHPTHLVEIVPLGFVRGQRIARLQINPIQYNPVRKQLKVYRFLQVRIDFNQPSADLLQSGPLRSAPNKTSSQPFEQFFETNLLNYQQAKMWRRSQRSPIRLARQREQRQKSGIKS